MVSDKTYVLITPARNEEAYIEKTIQSVVSQTILPQRWIIVSDRSTDRTDEIVIRYAQEYDFIRYVRSEGSHQRTFTSKVNAFNVGYEKLEGLDYNFLGNLDADVTFEPAYYENLLNKFLQNKKLGIAGGVRYDLCNGRFEKVASSRVSVGGAFQVFRRQCYEDIGGFVPVEIGSEDTIAQIMARMHGWETEAFPEITVYHYRCTGTVAGSILQARFRSGTKDYLIGHHPLFELAKCLYRMTERPYAVGSLFRISGYCWASFCHYKRPVPDTFVRYLRAEQLASLWALLEKGRTFAFRG
ncbi:MAG: glycosyltransferase family 2 protein [Candidatus Binatia bacterium]